jgi:cyclic-di-GMP-binding protein
VPTFDIVSELDLQEVRNAVDQANREASTRFDFKNTDSHVEFSDKELVLTSSTEDRLKALTQVLEEKLVRREVSLKALDPQKVEEAAKGTARQHIVLKAGISQEVGKSINRLMKGVSSSVQGDQVRVTGKKRDDLQAVIAACRAADLGVPLQYQNFRD